eukprot:jgi/Phyca11/17677/fgenesh1_pg.PHYCAscaffold_29_\
MLRYLECYEVKQSETDLNDIIDGTIAPGSKCTSKQLAVYSRQNKLLAKIISTSLSCTLSRQVMDIKSGSEMWSYLSKRFEGRENATTTLFPQRTLRQKLDLASCRPGADLIGSDKLNSPVATLDKNALVENEKDAQRQSDFDQKVCFYGHKPGHRKFECPEKKRDGDADGGPSGGAAGETHAKFSASAAAGDAPSAAEGGGHSSRASSDAVRSKRSPKSKEEGLSYDASNWCFDPACNRSLVGGKRYFLTYRTLDESEKEPIYSIHGITMPEGVGTIEIWWNVQEKIVSVQLENVYYAKDNENLISQYKMETQGYKVYYDTDRHVISAKKDDVLSMWVRRNSIGMYFIKAEHDFLAQTAGYVLDAKYNEGVVYKERHEQVDEVVDWSYEAESDAVDGVNGAEYNIRDDASESFEAAAEERRLEGPVESVFYDADAKIPAHELVFNEIRKYDAGAVADDEDAVEEPEPEGEPEPDEDGEVESIAETADEAEADAADVSALEDTATPKTEGGSVDEEADSESEDQETYDSAAELTGDTDMEIDRVTKLMELYTLECAVNMKKQVARTQQKGCTQGSAELDCVSMTATENRSSRSLSVETERVWHESEVRPPRAYKAVMNSLQHKEGWKGMEEEMAATEAKDVLELVSETEMPKGRKVLNTT